MVLEGLDLQITNEKTMKNKVSIHIDNTNFLNLNELSDEKKKEFYEMFRKELEKNLENKNI